VDLASASWKCSRDEARQRLASHFPSGSPIGKSKPNTVEEIWHGAEKILRSEQMPKEVISIIHHLNYNKPADEHCERYGYVSAAVLYPLLHRPLRIPKSKYYVVVPSWSSLTKLAGIHLVTKHKDRVVRDYVPCDKDRPEGGLTGLEECIKSGEGTVYAVYEPLIAPRISKIQHRYSEALVPMVGWHWDDQARTTLAWQSLSGKKIVFWGPKLTWYMVCMAAMTDGHICAKGYSGTDYETLSTYVRQREPLELIEWLSHRTRTWQTAMNKWITNAAPDEITAMIRHMRLNHFDPQLITSQLKSPSQGKWSRCLDRQEKQNNTQAVYLANRKIRILRTRTGWFVQQTNDVWSVLNADLRFTALFTRGGQAWYRGHLVHGDVTYPFEGPAKEVEGECWLWLRNLAALYQINIEYSSKLKAELFEIATLFHRPATMAESDMPVFDPTPIKKRDNLGQWIAPLPPPATISTICEGLGGDSEARDPVRSEVEE